MDESTSSPIDGSVPGPAHPDGQRIGDDAALYELVQRTARQVMDRMGRGLGVETVDVANECYLRLGRIPGFEMLDRPAFAALVATVVRNLLVDMARRANTERNAGYDRRVSFADVELIADAPDVDMLDLDAALTELASLDARQSLIVQLKFFAGLTGDEIAAHLGLSRRTVTDEWVMARAWLHGRLTRERA